MLSRTGCGLVNSERFPVSWFKSDYCTQVMVNSEDKTVPCRSQGGRSRIQVRVGCIDGEQNLGGLRKDKMLRVQSFPSGVTSIFRPQAQLQPDAPLVPKADMSQRCTILIFNLILFFSE